MTYYDRQATTHLDGTQIFQNDDDRQAERDVAARLAAAWDCRIVSFGALAPVDWYAERNGRLIGVLELKSRSVAKSQYSTVFLNVRKWLALQLASVGLRCPALFVVKFTDAVLWSKLRDIDAGDVKVLGCSRFVKSVNDMEPVIEVPIATMRALQ